ncbi:MAG: hypothetical protein AAB215_00080 [Planctomycetota bacterium]
MRSLRRAFAMAALLLGGCAQPEEASPPQRRPAGPPPWATPKPKRPAFGRIVEARILETGTGRRWPDLAPAANGWLRIRLEKGAPDVNDLADATVLNLWEPDAPNRFRPGDLYEADLYRDGMGEWKCHEWRYIPPPPPEEAP